MLKKTDNNQFVGDFLTFTPLAFITFEPSTENQTMKKTLLLFVLGFTFFNGIAQTEWKRTSIDEIVSVEIPGEPEKKDEQNGLSYSFRSKDSAAYAINVIDFSKFGYDSATLQAMVPQEMFLEQIKTLMTQQLPGAEIKEAKIITVGNYTAYDIVIETDKNGKKNLKYSLLIFVGSKAYWFVYASSETSAPESKERFFKSIEIK